MFWLGKARWGVAAALVLGVLIFGGYAAALPKPGGALPAAPNKDKNQEMTWIYGHTYDEVFQACQEVIKRMGLFVSAKDKDKGTMSGGGTYQGGFSKTITFDVRIEGGTGFTAEPAAPLSLEPADS
jgi:hypothetical protein